MAFDIGRLVCLWANGQNTVYAYHSFSYDYVTGVSTPGDVGGTSGIAAGYRNGGAGFFKSAKHMLRVGDIILAGVSRGYSGGAPTTAGVSGLVVTHVSDTALAGVTVAGNSRFGKGLA